MNNGINIELYAYSTFVRTNDKSDIGQDVITGPHCTATTVTWVWPRLEVWTEFYEGNYCNYTEQPAVGKQGEIGKN